MKAALLIFIILSSNVFAQGFQLSDFKKIILEKKELLEKVYPGISKKETTTSTMENCSFRIISSQTIIKVQEENMYIFAKEKFQPQNSEACRLIGYTASSEQSILYLENKPSVTEEIADLDLLGTQFQSLSRDGDLLTMHLLKENEKITVKYDLTKPSFKNLISSQSLNYSLITEDMPDTDIKSFDLSKVLFCETNDQDEQECTEGNYSDILF